MTREELQKIVDNPLTSPSNRAKAQQLIEKLDRPKPKPVSAPTVAPSLDDFEKMFQGLTAAQPTQSTPTPKMHETEKSETKIFADEQQAAKKVLLEPVERKHGTLWSVDGEEHIYLAFNEETKTHILTPLRNRGSLAPVTVNVSEEKLLGRDKPRGKEEPRFISDGFVGTLAQIRERNRQRQTQAAAELRARGGYAVGTGDPEVW